MFPTQFLLTRDQVGNRLSEPFIVTYNSHGSLFKIGISALHLFVEIASSCATVGTSLFSAT